MRAMPREEKFFDLFEAHAVKLTEGARVLSTIMDGGENLQANFALLMKLEDEADPISHDVMQCRQSAALSSRRSTVRTIKR